MAEWEGMTARGFEEIQNQDQDADDKSVIGSDDFVDDSQNTDVSTDSSTDDANSDDDFGDDNNEGIDGQDDVDDVDDRGVSWKNRAMELERKMKVLEAKVNKDQGQQPTPPMAPPPPTPPQFNQFQQGNQDNQVATPIDYQLEVVKQRMLQAGQGPNADFNKYHELSLQASALQAQKIIADQSRGSRELEMKTRIWNDYPDAFNSNSLLAQWSDHFFRTAYYGNPNDIESAVRKAAEHLGVRPKSAKANPVQSTTPSKLPRSRPQAPITEKGVSASSNGKQVKIPQDTLRTAQKLGVSVKDIQKMIKRQNYAFSSGDFVFGD